MSLDFVCEEGRCETPLPWGWCTRCSRACLAGSGQWHHNYLSGLRIGWTQGSGFGCSSPSSRTAWDWFRFVRFCAAAASGWTGSLGGQACLGAIGWPGPRLSGRSLHDRPRLGHETGGNGSRHWDNGSGLQRTGCRDVDRHSANLLGTPCGKRLEGGLGRSCAGAHCPPTAPGDGADQRRPQHISPLRKSPARATMV